MSEKDVDKEARSDGWSIADWMMFSLGIAGAGYELFIEPNPSYVKVILILALLRLWQSVADLLRAGIK